MIEFEVSPGLPCFDFRDYCRKQVEHDAGRGDGIDGSPAVFEADRSADNNPVWFRVRWGPA